MPITEVCINIQSQLKAIYTDVDKIYKLDTGGKCNEGIYLLCSGNDIDMIIKFLESIKDTHKDAINKQIIEINKIIQKGSRRPFYTPNLIKAIILLNMKDKLHDDWSNERVRWSGDKKEKTIDGIIEHLKLGHNYSLFEDDIKCLTYLLPKLVLPNSDVWTKTFLASNCKRIIKLREEKHHLELIKEFTIQKYMYDLNHKITPRPISIRKLSLEGKTLISLEMEKIIGHQLCEGCPDGNVLETENDTPLHSFNKMAIDTLMKHLFLMNTNGISHNDLNLENIFISDIQCYIIDWGEATAEFLGDEFSNELFIQNNLLNDSGDLYNDSGLLNKLRDLHRDISSKRLAIVNQRGWNLFVKPIDYFINKLEGLITNINKNESLRTLSNSQIYLQQPSRTMTSAKSKPRSRPIMTLTSRLSPKSIVSSIYGKKTRKRKIKRR